MSTTATVSVVAAAAPLTPQRRASLVWTGWNRMAKTAAHPSGRRKGATTR
jgi:hypothetical protein